MTGPESVTTTYGVPLAIRPLRVADRPALAAAFGRLSERTRCERFLGPKPRLSAAYLTEIDHRRHEAIVAVDPSDGALVGVARYATPPGVADSADMAVVVADAWQGQGIGTLLSRRLLARAGENGIGHLTATAFEEQRPRPRAAPAARIPHDVAWRGRRRARARLTARSATIARWRTSREGGGTVAGSVATLASVAVAGSAATVASAAVAGSAATAASAAVAGSAATLGQRRRGDERRDAVRRRDPAVRADGRRACAAPAAARVPAASTAWTASVASAASGCAARPVGSACGGASRSPDAHIAAAAAP